MKELDLWQRLDQIEEKLDLLLAKKKPVQRKPVSENTKFDAFWKIYPLKKGKKAALSAYNRLKFSGMGVGAYDLILRDVSNRIENDAQWIAGYIPHASTYLNGERWTDEITPVAEKAATVPADNDDLKAWAVDKGFRNPAPGESWNEYRRVVEQLYRGAS